MSSRFFLLFGLTAVLVLSACASTKEERAKYDAMDCEMLTQLAENYNRTNWLDQVDLYNDGARQDERRNSGSPWSDKSEIQVDHDDELQKERDLVRGAYIRKGCKG